jgi:hypothetical protein
MGRQALAKPWAAGHRLGIVLLRYAGQWKRIEWQWQRQGEALSCKGKAKQVRATAMPRLGQQRGGEAAFGTATRRH